MGWLFVPGLEVSSSASDCSEETTTAPCVSSSGKPTPRRLSWRGWKRRSWIRLLSGTISRPSMARLGVESWISSLRASRVSRSRSPETARAPRTPDGSGPTWSDCLGTFDRAGLFSRMSLDLFDSGSPTPSPDWPDSGTMWSGAIAPRPELVLPIDESGSSFSPADGTSWTTPTADDLKNRASQYAQGGTPLPGQAKMWPTARAEETPDQIAAGRAKGHGVSNLNETASLWPTPAARDEKGANGPEHLESGTGRLHLDQLPSFVRFLWPTPTAGDSNAAGGREGSYGRNLLTLTDEAIWGHSRDRSAPSTHPRPHQIELWAGVLAAAPAFEPALCRMAPSAAAILDERRPRLRALGNSVHPLAAAYAVGALAARRGWLEEFLNG